MEQVITASDHIKRYLIIPSGGSGVRMGAELPKQYIRLGGKTILQHTIEALAKHVDYIVLGISYDYRIIVEDMLQTMGLADRVHLTVAGRRRFDTVQRALRVVPDGVLVGIHDAVRPFVSGAVVNKCYEEAQRVGAAVPVLQLTESLRYLPEDGKQPQPSQAINRSHYRLVRTPQVFWSERIKEAYQQPFQESFTDDCSVYDQLYSDLALVPDTTENIKITTPDQLYWGEHLLSISRQERLRLTKKLLSSR
ncbi:IspD/TarI family cytidylyltransferase [Porphyromonas asaccharolytica]|uniref:2-C-methyl-D-erythritol 4-phosphate cytidylyltransferase n=1 Tax=Porphyromonas asaccharolytica (strain ATCC 25260 / DSM 20707 / BCRC 10618 / CCUG 7834 / JCM 6326 / LMG 13178 / VPI 4198 / B440) TaxID=879243 RepID=F4KMI7_PORAD|nr:IspD/TarI family cytidylyltransferase [Porphyromonas asaccharolytica]AEE13286.1 2-C-methyl-D-erythritol 4-phosphate cytidylyltransferase [Porphyromonas asaccharolytica DSM 20707]